MSRIPEKLLKWRKQQGEGRIMGSETFKKIAMEAAKIHGKKRGQDIAGAAYWQAAKSKYKKQKEDKGVK